MVSLTSFNWAMMAMNIVCRAESWAWLESPHNLASHMSSEDFFSPLTKKNAWAKSDAKWTWPTKASLFHPPFLRSYKLDLSSNRRKLSWFFCLGVRTSAQFVSLWATELSRLPFSELLRAFGAASLRRTLERMIARQKAAHPTRGFLTESGDILSRQKGSWPSGYN